MNFLNISADLTGDAGIAEDLPQRFTRFADAAIDLPKDYPAAVGMGDDSRGGELRADIDNCRQDLTRVKNTSQLVRIIDAVLQGEN